MLGQIVSWLSDSWPTQPAKADYPGHAYQGAGLSGLSLEWALSPVTSANRALQYDLPNLVRRARELARNDPYARRFLEMVAENVVGPEGFQLQSLVRSADGSDFDASAMTAVEAAWKEWSRAENCSVNRRSSWLDVQRMLAIGEARDGEAFLRIFYGWENPWGFAVQVLDPDLLDIGYNEPETRSGNRVVMGVEVDPYDRVRGYHFWSSHPSDDRTGRERVFIPADQVVHYYAEERPGQLRGVPRVANILFELSMLKGYREAEVTAARVSASKVGIFTPDPDVVVDLTMSSNDMSDQPEVDAEPGSFMRLPPGWKFEGWDPQHPNSAYPDFERAMTRAIATGLGVSYSALTGDYTAASWSSERSSKLAERDSWRVQQERLNQILHERIFPLWLRWALTMRRIPYPVSQYERLLPHRFQPRGWGWVDPANEQDAAERQVMLGINSRTRIAAAQGRDIADVIEEIRREEALAAAAGIDISGQRGSSAAADPQDAYILEEEDDLYEE